VLVYRESNNWSGASASAPLRNKAAQWLTLAADCLLLMDGGHLHVLGYDLTPLVGAVRPGGSGGGGGVSVGVGSGGGQSTLSADLVSVGGALLAVRAAADARAVHCTQLRTGRAVLPADRPLTLGAELLLVRLDPVNQTIKNKRKQKPKLT